jgi:hypothetical protein
VAQESSQLREQVLGTQHSGRKIGRRLVGGVLRGGSGRRRRRRRRAGVTPESTRRTLVDGMHLDACLERQERTLVGNFCECATVLTLWWVCFRIMITMMMMFLICSIRVSLSLLPIRQQRAWRGSCGCDSVWVSTFFLPCFWWGALLAGGSEKGSGWVLREELGWGTAASLFVCEEKRR